MLLDLSEPPLERCESTQPLARALAAAGAPEGTVVWALEQTAGRGRGEANWFSPRGLGLWLSVVLRPHVEPRVWPGLTGLLATAAATSLEGSEGCPPGWVCGIKWPNDLHGRRGKLAGILAETAGGAVVLGFGLDLTASTSDLPDELQSVASSLQMEGFDPVPSVEQAAGSLNEHLTAAYARFQNGDRDHLHQALRARFLLRGARVSIRDFEVERQGIAEDVGPLGELLLRTESGVISLVSGSVLRIEPRRESS